MDYRGTLYRAIHPKFARQPLSGEGASLFGGRFNRKGQPALYTSTDVTTCLFEINQTGGLFPSTLVSYDAHFQNVMAWEDLGAADRSLIEASGSWREEMQVHGAAFSQDFAQALSRSHDGLLVPSFEPRARRQGGMNLVLWHWGPDLPHRLSVIDPENRLAF